MIRISESFSKLYFEIFYHSILLRKTDQSSNLIDILILSTYGDNRSFPSVGPALEISLKKRQKQKS